MTTRDQLFQNFGPLLDEAIVDVLLVPINQLLAEQGLPPFTKQDFLDATANDVSHLPLYDWMQDDPDSP